MAFCKKCGAYIPIGETACPACGYDPEAEARQAKEAEEAKKRAEEEERRRKEEADAWAAKERRRVEEERRRAEERRKQGYSGSASQSQYAPGNSGHSYSYQSQQASQQKETWVPPWSQQQSASSQQQTGYADYDEIREQARQSVEKQKLSVLSYLGPLVFIPLLTRNNDDFARYHSNQGLALFVTNALVSVAGSWFAGDLGALVATGGSFFCLYCMIKGIRNVLHGKKEPLPLIGNFKFLK